MQDLVARARSELRHEPIERRVRGRIGADAIVDSTRAMLVWEPRRVCPSYKGEASYWSVHAGGRRREDLGWSYEQPLPDVPAISGLVAFWDEQVDVFLDGERREPPGGAISDALRDEFGV
jgi:hypothetical protein